ncbi:hypothetical protein [Hymenobacter volaticus]|uniref:Uncharacterized protein n=1 Tax=Hymenobacter volaticus TaxID=2932254 RepID=A0ABY4G2D4_9BACT|nr:hypothetical protein [Hymenobacter volaticus]UOQ64819.1 hypothetical protein MUN86_14740 [Hymenobacter volaticus]
MLVIDNEQIDLASWPLVYLHVQRQALLGGYAVLWEERFLKTISWPGSTPAFRLQFVIGEINESIIPVQNVIDLRIDLPPMNEEISFYLWTKIVPASTSWNQDEFKSMVRRQRATIGQMISVSKKEITTVNEVAEQLRILSRQELGDLARPIDSSFSWNDLVISESLRNSLDDFYFEASERSVIWENEEISRLFPLGRGCWLYSLAYRVQVKQWQHR